MDILLEGKTKRVICYRDGEYIDMDINEALAMKKSISEYQYEVSYSLSHNYSKIISKYKKEKGVQMCALFLSGEEEYMITSSSNAQIKKCSRY